MANSHPPIRWEDASYHSSRRIVLTQAELQIPGIHTLGWHDMRNAIPALQAHFHENCFEITFVTKGTIPFSAGGQEYAVYGGDAFVTRPDEIHGTNEAPMSVGEICWLQLDVSNPEQFLFLNREAAEALVSMLYQICSHRVRTDNGVTARLLRNLIETVIRAPQSYNRYEVANSIVSYLYQLCRFADAADTRVTLDIAKACEYISHNLREELTLDEVAAVSCLSVSQFKQKFKSQIGVAPRNYINQQKIEQIKRVLTPDAVLTQVSSDFGFCNSSYFSSVFKKYTGKTPTQYIIDRESSGF